MFIISTNLGTHPRNEGVNFGIIGLSIEILIDHLVYWILYSIASKWYRLRGTCFVLQVASKSKLELKFDTQKNHGWWIREYEQDWDKH